ncbi:guanine deaminase [Aethina tumida]|uniref:guanine deaminase n=1 Tax=Aethina tumida TaxID=116153 RepID=UPI00096B4D71|nr:guanine deaminase [Aethina tumida]
MASLTYKIFIGSIVHCKKPFELEVIKDGFLIVHGRKIIHVDNDKTRVDSVKQKFKIADSQVIELTNTQLLIPGLIDTHIHAPQYPNAGLGYDKPLLEWLDSYTYKIEQMFKDQTLSYEVFNAVVRKTLSYGTTTATYFASLFDDSSMVLADAAITHGQRAFIGKINMTKLAPDNYVETVEQTLENTRKFVEDLTAKNIDLVQPILTPRFALSLEMDTMQKLSEIAKEYDLNIQTHISENKDEVQIVNDTFGMNYANVYEKSGLLGPKTVLAHGVYLKDDEMKLLAKTGTSISHCPDSNTMLQSGLCDVRRLIENGITVGLGTDVSGGPSPSIIQAMRGAIQTSIHIAQNTENYTPLNYIDAFSLATLGGANALKLQDKIGNFEVGKEFDALVIDADVDNSAIDFFLTCDERELLQKFIFVGDDRNVVRVYVAGKCVK